MLKETPYRVTYGYKRQGSARSAQDWADQADCAMIATDDVRWELYLYVKDNVPMVEVYEVHINPDAPGGPTELTSAVREWTLEDLT